VPAATKKGIVIALVALTLVAFVERWAGLRFLLPHSREADTAIVHIAALHDLPAGQRAKRRGVRVDDLHVPVLERADRASRIELSDRAAGGSDARAASRRGGRAVHACAQAHRVAFVARRAVHVFDCAEIPGAVVSVFATALVTTSLLGLEMAQQAKPHGGLAGTTALALVAILGILRSASIRAYLFAGVACALALGSLLSGAFVLPSLAVAHLVAWRADRERKRWIVSRSRRSFARADSSTRIRSSSSTTR
jgi:hypothetical protein